MCKKILCVIRTSTNRQETDSQHDDMLGFLTSSGLRYSEDEIEWLEARGASARKITTEYLNMLDTIKATILGNPDITACAFWHLNRLGRWEKYIVDMKSWFIEHHIQVYVKTPNLTLLKDDGSLDNGANIAWGVFASMVSYDTMELMEKTMRGKKAKADKGLYAGGGIPYGFKVVNDKVVEDPNTIGNIHTIFSEYSTGNYSTKKLELELKSRGLKFADYFIGKILRRELYKPIVGEELWNKCQTVLAGNKWTTKQSRNGWISLKVVKCSSCGSNCICVGKKYTCYNHHMAFRYDNACTNNLMIKASVIDLLLFDIAYEMEFNSLYEEPDTTELENKHNINSLKITETYKQLDILKEKQYRLQEAYLDLSISKETLQKRKSGLIKESISLQAQLSKLIEENDTIAEQIKLLKNPNLESVAEAFLQEELSEPYKRSLIKKYIKVCIPKRTTIDGNAYTEIAITTIKDETYKYYYFSHHRGKHDSDNIYVWNEDENKMESYIDPIIAETYNTKWEIQRDIIKNGLLDSNKEVPELVSLIFLHYK